MTGDLRTIQWTMWANESALLGAYALLVGGVIGIIGGIIEEFTFWLPMGIYGLLFGLVISLLEYPRGKKNKGNTIIRWKQELSSQLVNKLPFMKVPYYRAFIYTLVCLPSILIVPTVLGSVGVIIGSLIYIRGGVHGEVWSPVVKKQEPTATNINQPPSRPPPRLPAQTSSGPPSHPPPRPSS